MFARQPAYPKPSFSCWALLSGHTGTTLAHTLRHTHTNTHTLYGTHTLLWHTRTHAHTHMCANPHKHSTKHTQRRSLLSFSLVDFTQTLCFVRPTLEHARTYTHMCAHSQTLSRTQLRLYEYALSLSLSLSHTLSPYAFFTVNTLSP